MNTIFSDLSWKIFAWCSFITSASLLIKGEYIMMLYVLSFIAFNLAITSVISEMIKHWMIGLGADKNKIPNKVEDRWTQYQELKKKQKDNLKTEASNPEASPSDLK